MNVNEFLKQIGIDNLLEELGLTELSEEKKFEKAQQIFAVLKDRLALRYLESLPANELAEVQSYEPEKFLEFLNSKGIDTNQIAIEEGVKLREELIANANFAAGYIQAKAEQDKPNQ
jgi:hypothetical protein